LKASGLQAGLLQSGRAVDVAVRAERLGVATGLATVLAVVAARGATLLDDGRVGLHPRLTGDVAVLMVA